MAGNSNLIQILAGTLIQIQNYARKTQTDFSAIGRRTVMLSIYCCF